MSTFRVVRAALAPLVLCALLVACQGATGPEAVTTMQVTQTCAKTQCDVRLEDAADRCDECTSLCVSASYGCNPSTACANSCATPRPCSDHELHACAWSTFVATLPTEASAPLADACKRAGRVARDCGWAGAPTDEDCDRYALVERPERVESYECIARLACDADPSVCRAPKTDFGATICAQAEASCGTPFCSPALVDRLDAEASNLRDDVLQAASACAAQDTCGDVRGCLLAWLDAVRP
jgi:hypothetical protein